MVVDSVMKLNVKTRIQEVIEMLASSKKNVINAALGDHSPDYLDKKLEDYVKLRIELDHLQRHA